MVEREPFQERRKQTSVRSAKAEGIDSFPNQRIDPLQDKELRDTAAGKQRLQNGSDGTEIDRGKSRFSGFRIALAKALQCPRE